MVDGGALDDTTGSLQVAEKGSYDGARERGWPRGRTKGKRSTGQTSYAEKLEGHACFLLILFY